MAKIDTEQGQDPNRGAWWRYVYYNGRGWAIGYGPKVYFGKTPKTYGPRNVTQGPGQVVRG